MGKQILIVDDDAAVTSFYSRYLAFEGYSVTIAETCAAATALLAHWRPDVIIVDWWLPDADGDVWATSLRLRSSSRKQPSSLLVTIVTPGVRTPRAVMQLCAASITTATPCGLKLSWMHRATSAVSRSCTCSRRA